MDEQRKHMIIGLGLLPVICLALGGVLYIGNRPLRPVIHLQAEFDQVGQLQPGGKVRIANHTIGRVKHIDFVDRRVAGKPVRRVRVHFWIERRYARQVFVNSEAYVAAPSLIGERHLELAAPDEKPPGRDVRPGDVLKGQSPSHLDRMLKLGYDSLVATTALTDAVDPHWKKLRRHWNAVDREIDTLRGYEKRITLLADRGEAVVEEAKQSVRILRRTTDDGRAFTRLRDRLDRFGQRAKAGGKPLLADLERVIDRFDVLIKALRHRLPDTIKAIRRHGDAITARIDQIKAFARIIDRAISTGKGTVGAFLKEKELWDDFKVAGKIIRQEIWRTIARPRKTSVKNSPVAP